MKILLAVDGSDPSDAAIAALRRQFLPPDSTIRVLCATGSLVMGAEPVAVDYARVEATMKRDATTAVERASKQLQGVPAGVEAKVLPGDPREAILEEATSWSADLIVMGCHGRSGLKRLVLGSVAEYVVRHAPCSVLVARRPLTQHRAT